MVEGPVKFVYIHVKGCGGVSKLNPTIAQELHNFPGFYTDTFCYVCKRHRPLEEFRWEDGTPVGDGEIR